MYPCHHPSPGRSRFVGHTLLLFAGLTLLTAAGASAGPPSPLELHREVREHVGDALRHLVRVPDRILDHHERHLDSFFGGREYYGPHRHHHVTYQFPVWVDGDVYYRPYTYCDRRLFGSVSVRPHLWVEWGHHASGHWCDRCHGYFPARHGHFRVLHHRPRYYGHHDRNRHHRPDWDRHDDQRRHEYRRDDRRRHEYRRDDRRRDDHRRGSYRRDDRRRDDVRRDDRRDRGRGGDRQRDRGRGGNRHRDNGGGGS